MQNNTKAVLMALMLSSTVVMAVAPSSQAAFVAPNPICLNGDWATVCLGTASVSRQIADVDPSKLVFHCTDPVGTGDICVPTVPSVIAAATASRNVNVVTATYSYQIHGANIIYDICMIVFGNPNVCRYTEITLADADNDGALDSVLLDNVAVPFTFA